MQLTNMNVVIENYYGYVDSIVKKYFLNYNDRQEYVMDIFLKVYFKSNKFNPEKGSFKSWLSILAKNYCIDMIRKRKKELVFVDVNEFYFKSLDDDKYDYSLDVLVDTCLSFATGEEVRLITLFYFENKKHKEIADLLGVKTNAVGTMIKRSTARIAKRIPTEEIAYKLAS
jgi:RNA polymerase sigma-70 factor (ECF subfamily)